MWPSQIQGLTRCVNKGTPAHKKAPSTGLLPGPKAKAKAGGVSDPPQDAAEQEPDQEVAAPTPDVSRQVSHGSQTLTNQPTAIAAGPSTESELREQPLGPVGGSASSSSSYGPIRTGSQTPVFPYPSPPAGIPGVGSLSHTDHLR